jgi:hypothetical protein
MNRWLELTIHATTTATLYSLADHLMGSGYESLEIQDGEEWAGSSAIVVRHPILPVLVSHYQ